MAIQISPGVNTTEIDLTTVVPSVLTTAGAFAGNFQWGPANKIMLIDSEITLLNTFGAPDANSANAFFTAANFLAYGNNLNVVRAVNTNSSSQSNNAVGGGSTGIQILNEDVYLTNYINGSANSYGSFAARYPGALGNSIRVSVCDTSSQFTSWQFKSLFTSAPGTSSYATQVGGSQDEMHIVVTDAGGLITGNSGQVLETFGFVSKGIDAAINGVSNYWKQVIFNKSKYIYAMDPPEYSSTHTTWGTATANTTFVQLSNVEDSYLTLGTNPKATDSALSTAYSYFANKESVNIQLILTGDADATVQNYIFSNVVSVRNDCIAFVSPPANTVINNAGSEASSIVNYFNNTLALSSSYLVADSNWKYQFDKFNNVYRWVPMNGDIAGLCVNTDAVADPWFSPAGFNRGAIKNVIKLAWNPSKPYRDTLYAAGINPIVSFPGQGVVLYGDKTLQSKPSAFDRINVRRLFLVLEKAISTAAQYSLFEFNDSFTQAQFVNLVTPFLRNVQGRRGITNFYVQCDSTNNTPAVINANQFVGSIYVMPNRSTNYIQLNFVAVNTGVDFSTVVGAV